MNRNSNPGSLCVGIIMDGNRRWAKGKKLPTLFGHKEGYATLKKVLMWAREKGVTHVVAYAFSTENWNRSPEEVSYLMDLCRLGLRNESKDLLADNIRLRVLGERSLLPADVQELIRQAEAATATCTGQTLLLAISYGSRAEITAAAAGIARDVTLGKLAITDVNETMLEKYLWSADIPDPDIIIRTGGEKRLSNFLLWQAAYSELFFTDTLWPDLSEEEFKRILDEFKARERRMGK